MARPRRPRVAPVPRIDAAIVHALMLGAPGDALHDIAWGIIDGRVPAPLAGVSLPHRIAIGQQLLAYTDREDRAVAKTS